MKRTPMTRKTPLTARTPMTRGTKPLTRATAPAARAPLTRTRTQAKPSPRKDTGPSTTVSEGVKKRDAGLCVRCGAPAGSVHHRSGRGMGGRQGTESARINQPAWLLCLCGSGVTGCHGWVESNRAKAKELGYLIPRNGITQDAETIPVRTRKGWRLFGNDYSVKRPIEGVSVA